MTTSSDSESTLGGQFQSCARHCWCAYSPNHEVIRRLGAEHIVEAMQATPHDHGTDRGLCTGCLLEDGRITRTLFIRRCLK